MFQKFEKLLYSLLIAFVVSAGFFVSTLFNIGFINEIKELTFDTYQQYRPRAFNPDLPVRIVDIDEESLKELGQWPWPRTKIADLITRLNDLGAASIGLDIVIAEADRLSPQRLLSELDTETSTRLAPVGDLIETLPDNDDILAAVIAATPTITSFAHHPENTETRPARIAGFSFGGPSPSGFLPVTDGFITTLSKLEDHAAGNGSISVSATQTSGIVRRIPLLTNDGETIYPSFVVEALRVAQGASGFQVKSVGASGETGAGTGVTAVKIGAYVVPTTSRGELWVHYTPSKRQRFVSARDLMREDAATNDQLRALIEGQIVLVGTSAVGLHDIRTTALGENVPGVEIHAQALEQILTEEHLFRPDWADGVEILLSIGTIAVLALLLPIVGPAVSIVFGAFIAAAIVALSWYLYIEQGILLDFLTPLGVGFFAYLCITVFLFLFSEKERRFVTKAFEHYLAPSVLARLQKAPDTLKLGGEIRELSIMFSDVRGFTPLSEQLTPEELVDFLNSLLTPLTDDIQNQEGTVDKYIGDAILAFWNAPLPTENHPERACLAALHMRRTVQEANATDRFAFKKNNFPFQEVSIGLGINTGMACVGNVGSSRRFDYSVIGDAVNVAARVESSCKVAGYDVLITGPTAEAVPDFALLEAGSLELKGKSDRIKLFALVGDPQLAKTEEFGQLRQKHQLLIKQVVNGTDAKQIDQALAACLQLAEKVEPQLATFYENITLRRHDFLDAAELPIEEVA